MPLDISNDLLIRPMSYSRLTKSLFDGYEQYEQSEFPDMPIHRAGESFLVSGDELIQQYYVEKNGDISLKSRSKLSSSFESYEIEPVQKTDVTMAEVVSFDNNYVVARVFFNDHPSTRKFKKSFVNMLKKQDLLYQGAVFNIVSKQNDDELSIKIERCSDYISPKVKDLYAKITESIDEEC